MAITAISLADQARVYEKRFTLEFYEYTDL